MFWISRLLNKSGSLGGIVAAMGCASCFPALGSLSAALGLGFLASYEGLFINTLLPLFAVIVLCTAVISFIGHKRWSRFIAGLIGPTMVLLTLYPLWTYNWSTYLFYIGLLVMFFISMWDIVSPAHRICAQKTFNRE